MPGPDQIPSPDDGDDGTPEPNDGPTTPPGRVSFGAALSLFLGRPAALLAAVTLPVLPAVVLGSLLFALLVPERLALTGGPVAFTAEVALSPGEWALLGGFTAVLAVSLGVGLTTALVVAAGARVGRRWDSGPALRRALARPGPTAVAVLTAVTALAALLAGVVVAQRTFLWTGAGVFFLLLMLVASPLAHQTARMVVSVPGMPSPGRWPLSKEDFREYTWRTTVVALVTAGLCVLVSQVLYLVPGPPLLLVTAMSAANGLVLALGGACLAALLVAQTPASGSGAAGTRSKSGADTAGEPGGQPVSDAPHTSPPQNPGSVRGRVTAVSATVLAVLTLPGLVWALPTGPTGYALEYTEMGLSGWQGYEAVELTAAGDDLRLLVDEARLWCDPACLLREPSEDDSEAEDPVFGTHTFAPGGGVRAGWTRTGTLEGELRLGTECGATGCHGPERVLRTVALEEFPYTGADPAFLVDVAEHADGFHVVAGFYDEASDAMVVEAHSCVGLDCADPVALGRAPVQERVHDSRNLLDAAAGPDGEPVAVLYDPPTGAVTLFRCADATCSDTEDTRVAPMALVAEPGNFYGRIRMGARVEVRPDGRPVIAYRSVRDGTSRLLDCADPGCAESEERVLTEPGWERHLPGLALDSEGRPRLALADGGTPAISLVECADTGCSEWETRVLHRPADLWGNADLVIGPEGHPVVAAVVRPTGLRMSETRPWVLALHRCGDPGCTVSR